MEAMNLRDPISLDDFTCPVLASDGYTYNADTLLTSMESDAWHRSPITGEILRPLAFPNRLVSEWVGCIPVHEPVCLYDTDACPPDGREVTFGLAQVLSCEDEITRHGWFLPGGAPISLQVTLRRDGPTRRDVLMHPPCPDVMRDDFTKLAGLFGIDRMVDNPWCLTTARLTVNGTCSSVENWWLQKHEQP